MQVKPPKFIGPSLLAASTLLAPAAIADAISDAITSGKANVDINIRYEDVSLGDTDSEQLSMRTRLGYTTGSYEGFSVMVEFEDTRNLLGEDDENGLIIDNENTEVDQAFLQYKTDGITAKLGRQVIALDGHRHVGHVGWRQDRQTFDAARIMFSPLEGMNVDLSYLWKRNRINSGDGGFPDPNNTSDTLLNVSYLTPFGKAVGYYYSLSQELIFDATDTVGFSFAGSTGDDLKILYALEFAQQDNETADVDTSYSLLELGVSTAGITAKLGLETLGSDDGIENFQTPLSTVHKFNGWADVFAGGSLTGTIDGGNGLEDMYMSLGTKVAGIKLLAVYHDFDSDEGSTDLGSEINLLAVKKFGKHYSAGFKYADYSKGDTGADKDIVWLWVGAKY